MHKRLIFIFSIVILLGVLGSMFLNYQVTSNNKRCPDGVVPFNNEIGLCPEKLPSDLGVETTYPTITCIEFKDKSKNYVPGEIIIGSNTNVQLQQIQELIADINTNLKKENPEFKVALKEQLLSSTDYIIAVPKGLELNIIEKLTNNPSISYAELNRCNQIQPGF